MNEIKVYVDVVVNPTEDFEKVQKAVSNIFPRMSIQTTSEERRGLFTIQGEGWEVLDEFHALLKQKRILAAARKIFLKGRRGNRIIFYLNKQVAYMKNISFCEPMGESPLGPIKIEIICDDSTQLIDRLTSPSST